MNRHDRWILRLLLMCCAAMVLCSLQWALPSGVEDDLLELEHQKYEAWKKHQLTYIDKNRLKVLVREIIREMGHDTKTNSKVEKHFIKYTNANNTYKNKDAAVLESKRWESGSDKNIRADKTEVEMRGANDKKDIKDKISKNGDAVYEVIKENIPPVVQPEVVYPPFVKFSSEDGPGEYGKGYVPELNATEKEKMQKMETINHFNVYVSDLISVHRRLPDSRPQDCKNTQHRMNLPKASIIMCFHNEAWSVLLRSIHSIIDRSPPELLREIILVDDASTQDHLKAPLDKYVSQLPKVRVLRSPQRGGLTRARLIGYNAAEGPVLVFLDSHIECYPGWLEPLLDRVATNPRTVPYPHVVPIQGSDFTTYNTIFTQVGFFHWTNLEFDWILISDAEKKRRTSEADPARHTPWSEDSFGNGAELPLFQTDLSSTTIAGPWSATMPGGLFAIDRDFFTYLGTYDPELLYWGGENMELSFKIWMCNGTIEHHPCSQVGHIFRSQSPIVWKADPDATIFRNSMRVAEVWMDDYKHFLYDASFKREDYGDITARKQLREKLQCHDFQWYMNNVYPLPVPQRALAAGEIRNAAKPMCLDGSVRTLVPGLWGCHGRGMNQWWQIKEGGLIMHDIYNFCYEGGQFKLQQSCTDNWRPYWIHHVQNGTLVHGPTKMCLQMSVELKLIMSVCSGSSWQQWSLPANTPT